MSSMTLTKFANMLRKLIIFALLADIMFVSKILMEFLPNVHLIAALIIIYTVVYRWEALIPIYIFVLLTGLYYGFSLWWVPYCYIWTILWAVVMLLPKKMPPKVARIVYIAVGVLHGLLFGVMYAPFQALAFHFDFEAAVAWVISGLPWDALHGVGNAIAGILILPLSQVLIKLESRFTVSERRPAKK